MSPTAREEELPPVAILSGGLATRLYPLTEKIPKALVLVNGQPFVSHQLTLLARQGVRRVVMCVSHLAEQIQAYVGDGRAFGLRVDYSLDGATQIGTGGAIRQALPLLGDVFFVLYGDSYLDRIDYRAIWAAYRASGQSSLMTVFRNEDQWDRSNVEFENGTIAVYDKVQRTQRMKHLDYGLNLLTPDAFLPFSETTPLDLSLVLQHLVACRTLQGYEVFDRFFEVGSVQGIATLENHLREKDGS